MPDKTTPHIQRAARAAYNAAVNNKDDDGWWDKFTEGERDVWRRATLAVLSTTKDPSNAEVVAALTIHATWLGYSNEVSATDENAMRAALNEAAKVRVGK